jgi:sRNA-binding regulator protein Hfq
LKKKRKTGKGKFMKKIVFAVLALFLFFGLTGCSLFAPKEKTFTSNGITITLNTDFKETDTDKFSVYLLSKDVAFMANKEAISTYTNIGVNSLHDYIESVLTANNFSDYTIQESTGGNDYVYSNYTSTVDGTEYKYLLVCMEGESNYYIMNFGTVKSDYDNLEQKLFDFADTISVE